MYFCNCAPVECFSHVLQSALFRSMHFINIPLCVWCSRNFLWLKLQMHGAKIKAVKILIKIKFSSFSVKALIQ